MSTTSERRESILTKCWCCIPLRMGCFIFGYLNLLINIFHTFALLSLTLVLCVYTHGFQYLDYNTPYEIAQIFPQVDSAAATVIKQLAIALIMVVFTNIAWIIINSACLIAIHQKSPGPIRLYVGFAIGRLMLSLIGFVYIFLISSETLNRHSFITHGIDIGIGGYFIILYYIYSTRLEQGKEDIPDKFEDCFSWFFKGRKSPPKKTPQKTV